MISAWFPDSMDVPNPMAGISAARTESFGMDCGMQWIFGRIYGEQGSDRQSAQTSVSRTVNGSLKSLRRLESVTNMPSGFPYKVVIGLTLIISMDTFVQLAWKVAATSLPETLSLDAIVTLLQQPVFLVVIGFMLCQLFIWLMV